MPQPGDLLSCLRCVRGEAWFTVLLSSPLPRAAAVRGGPQPVRIFGLLTFVFLFCLAVVLSFGHFVFGLFVFFQGLPRRLFGDRSPGRFLGDRVTVFIFFSSVM